MCDIFVAEEALLAQLDKIPKARITAADLLDIGSEGRISLDGVKGNVRVGLEYLEAWMSGVGCVPINHLMEDAATAEICRCQSAAFVATHRNSRQLSIVGVSFFIVWQWIRHNARTTDKNSVRITKELVRSLVDEASKERVRRVEQEVRGCFERVGFVDWSSIVVGPVESRCDKSSKAVAPIAARRAIDGVSHSSSVPAHHIDRKRSTIPALTPTIVHLFACIRRFQRLLDGCI